MRRCLVVILVAGVFGAYAAAQLPPLDPLSASAAVEGPYATDERGAAEGRSARLYRDRTAAFTAAPRGPSDGFSPAPGEPVFDILIPAIGVSERVVQGTDQAQLAEGPGHYPECGNAFSPPYCSPFEEVWPGERGRVIVGGHRSIRPRPFFDAGELTTGDEIIVHAPWGRFLYVVRDTKVVAPDDRSIIVPDVRRRELVLVTCHPKFSAAKRLLIFSDLVREVPGTRYGATTR